MLAQKSGKMEGEGVEAYLNPNEGKMAGSP